MDGWDSFFDLLIKDLLTKKELKVLQKRFQIIKLLKTDLTYRQIAKKTKVSTTTIVRLNQRLSIKKRQLNKKKRPKTITGITGSQTKHDFIEYRKLNGDRTLNFYNNRGKKKGKRLPWVIG